MGSNGQTCTPWQQNSNPEVGDLVRCQNQISIGRYFLECEPLSVNLGSRIRPEFWEPVHGYDAPAPSFLYAHLHFHMFIFWNSSTVCPNPGKVGTAFQGGAAPPRGGAVFLRGGPTAGPPWEISTTDGDPRHLRDSRQAPWYLGTGHDGRRLGADSSSIIQVPEEERQVRAGTWAQHPQAPGALVSWVMGKGVSGGPGASPNSGAGASLDLTGLRVGRSLHTHVFKALALEE